MKKIYTFVFACLSLVAQAQNAVPNGNFEQWTSATYEIPQFGTQSSNTQSFYKAKAPFNCVKTTDAYHGSYALKLTTVMGIETNMGYFTNSNPSGGSPCSWTGGVAYNQKPTGFKGHYKSNVQVGDSAGMLIVFKKAGVCLGTYMYKFGGVKSIYTAFSFALSPALSATPDTVIFAAISSDIFNNVQKAGSTITLDSLAFTGVTSQPVEFDGSFETWQSVTLKSPDNWYINTDDQGSGYSQTADAYKGLYAIELKTYMGDNNNISRAQGGGVSTGYSVCQSGPCTYKGGYAFNKQVDTLAFYYKYAPSGNDSAVVSFNFKKNGATILSTNKYIHTASSYTKMEFPFSLGTAPDTVIVEFRSSAWNDTLLSFIGSSLKVDEIHFKSQPLLTGIESFKDNKTISVYPNPSSDGFFTINHVSDKGAIQVFNILGEEVNVALKNEKGNTSVQLPSNVHGIYFIKINSGGKIFTEKIIVGK